MAAPRGDFRDPPDAPCSRPTDLAISLAGLRNEAHQPHPAPCPHVFLLGLASVGAKLVPKGLAETRRDHVASP